MYYSVLYDSGGKIHNVLGSSDLSGISKKGMPAEAQREELSWGVVTKIPEEAAGFGTLEVMQKCRVSKVISDRVEIEVAKKD